ncbi:MAG: methyltransferase family protein [Limnochordia bacterium]|jgi:protein-S-isoprenylcysteine O-methyltransferase Ste14
MSGRPAAIRTWWMKNIVFLIITGADLFLAAGRIRWGMAWAYLVSMSIIMVANAAAMDPSLLVERSQLQEETKEWDVPLVILVSMWGPLVIGLMAGLDIRFEWSRGITPMLQVAALLLVVAGGALGTWSMASNPFFSATVRIQTERDHRVITQGPYRYVRHPGYVGGIVFALMSPIALGSWVALAPGLLVACGYALRTCLEDKALLHELPGYQDYAELVRYRFIPGIW